MTESISENITADMTLLDIVSKWPSTETVFRRYDQKVGACLCCTCLFDSLNEIAERCDLNLEQFIRELLSAAVDRNEN